MIICAKSALGRNNPKCFCGGCKKRREEMMREAERKTNKTLKDCGIDVKDLEEKTAQ